MKEEASEVLQHYWVQCWILTWKKKIPVLDHSTSEVIIDSRPSVTSLTALVNPIRIWPRSLTSENPLKEGQSRSWNYPNPEPKPDAPQFSSKVEFTRENGFLQHQSCTFCTCTLSGTTNSPTFSITMTFTFYLSSIQMGTNTHIPMTGCGEKLGPSKADAGASIQTGISATNGAAKARPETPAATSTVADDLFLNQNWKLCGITFCHKKRILFFIWPSIVTDNTFCILGDTTKWTQKMSKNCKDLENMERMRQDFSTPLEIRLNFCIQQQVIFLVKSKSFQVIKVTNWINFRCIWWLGHGRSRNPFCLHCGITGSGSIQFHVTEFLYSCCGTRGFGHYIKYDHESSKIMKYIQLIENMLQVSKIQSFLVVNSWTLFLRS